jgi:hypothetical protein
LTSCRHELVRVQEQIRRKDELCAQLQTRTSASEDQNNQQLTSLCRKINALENDLQVISEEDCIGEWRRLRLRLDQWVKRHFKDAEKLGHLNFSANLELIGATAAHTQNLVAGNAHQRWAILQAWITRMLNDNIFNQYCPGLNGSENELFFRLDRQIHEQSSANTWRHCKSGINTALGSITKPSQALLIAQLVDHVELKLGEYASTAPRLRQQQLHSIFSQCADFKKVCNKQPHVYNFVSSPPGHAVDLTCMTAAGIIDCSETTVALSLWQSLWKEENSGNQYCLEPELIWAIGSDAIKSEDGSFD